MNTKKLALFGASAVVLGAGLVYALGIFPPAAGRDGQGAIGQRTVYHAAQPADASVNPNNAPVAATPEQLKDGQVVTPQNGQLNDGIKMQMQNDGMKMQMQNNGMQTQNNGMKMQMQSNGMKMQMQNDGMKMQMQNTH